MYFVMTESIHRTVAMTSFLEMAEWIASKYLEDYGERCIIRWSGNKA